MRRSEEERELGEPLLAEHRRMQPSMAFMAQIVTQIQQQLQLMAATKKPTAKAKHLQAIRQLLTLAHEGGRIGRAEGEAGLFAGADKVVALIPKIYQAQFVWLVAQFKSDRKNTAVHRSIELLLRSVHADERVESIDFMALVDRKTKRQLATARITTESAKLDAEAMGDESMLLPRLR